MMTSGIEKKSCAYLDIDGVLLVDESPFEMSPLNPLEKYAPLVVDRLGKCGLDLIFLSTWGWEASYLVENISAFKDATILEERVRDIQQKKDNLIADQVALPRPFVWADDMMTPEIKDEVSSTLKVPHLLISPDKRVGLTGDDLDSIEKFAARYRD